MTDKKAEDAIEVIDGSVVEPQDAKDYILPEGERQEEQSENKREFIYKSPADEARERIAARHRESRKDRGIDATGDFTDPAQSYGKFGQPQQQEEQLQVEEPAPKDDRRFTLKVRGVEREITEQEMIEAAQKTLAGDSYLEESRKILEEAKKVAQSSRHHPDETDDLPEPPPEPDDGQHPDQYDRAIDEIQYGDRSKAKVALKSAVSAEVAAARVQDLMAEHHRSGKRALDEFVAKNPDLAKDEFATTIIKREVLKGYQEDLRSLGVPEDKIPPVEQDEVLSKVHQAYAVQGQKVRDLSTILEGAKTNYFRWRGANGRAATPEPRPAPKPGTISVTVDRTERRMAIPHQPSRADVPQQTSPQTRTATRTDAVMAARRARGQTTV